MWLPISLLEPFHYKKCKSAGKRETIQNRYKLFQLEAILSHLAQLSGQLADGRYMHESRPDQQSGPDDP